MRRFLSILAVVAVVCLASCGGEAERTADGRLIIDYWEKWQGFEKDAMAAVVDKYNASQDKVFVRYVSQSQIDRKLLLATAGGNPPDVAGFWSRRRGLSRHSIASWPATESRGRITSPQ
jgi:ABC-type glycerol-3-phosphate transport system substrate-binding protein